MTPSRWSLGPHHGPRLVIAAAAVCLGIVAAWGPPLGHDEAVYALGGDSLLHPSAGDYPPYRPDGMRLLAAAGLLVGRTDLALRLLPVGLTILLLLVLASSGKSLKMGGDSAFGLALLLTPVVLRRGAQLGSDIPACVFLLLVCHVLVASATRSRWLALWLAPLGAAAYYVRYGSIVALGCLAIVFASVWWEQLRRLLVPLVVTGLLFAALLVPHLIDSIEKTGSPLGIFVLAGEVAHRRYLGEGLVYYLTVWWWRDVGPVMTLLLAYGVVATVRTTDRRVRFLGLSSLAMIAVYGVSTHGESRYVLLPMILLGMIGAQRFGVKWRSRWLPVLAAMAVVTAALSVVVAVNLESPRAPHLGAQMVTWIRKTTPAMPCATLSLHHRQVAWYTQCHAFSPDNYDFATPAPVFLLVFSADRVSATMARTVAAADLLAVGPGVLVYRFPGRQSASLGQ